jgi:hypothetical protein
MTEQFSITLGTPVPPDELIEEWKEQYSRIRYSDQYPIGACSKFIAHRTATWAANEQLRLCVQWLDGDGFPNLANRIQRDMRPKPPSPKQQALEELEMMQDELHAKTGSGFATPALDRILESLPD